MNREQGSITPLVPVLMLAFLLLGGLVIDGSRDLNARSDAQAYAEEAARAGAGAVDLTSSVLALDRTKVAQNVKDYCDAVTVQNGQVQSCELDTAKGPDGISTATTCEGKSAQIVVNTVVTIDIKTTLLGIVGFQDLSATAHAKARPFQGLTADDAC